MTATRLDMTWLVIVSVIVVTWMLRVGILIERHRGGGTISTRRQRDLARAQRDEARRQLAEVCAAYADTVGHPVGLPRPGTGRRAGQPQTPSHPAAETRPFHVVRDGSA